MSSTAEKPPESGASESTATETTAAETTVNETAVPETAKLESAVTETSVTATAVTEDAEASESPSEEESAASEALAYSAEDARFVRLAVEAAAGRHAEGTMVLHLAQVSDFTDYFMICHGTNDRQVQAITDGIVRALREQGLRPLHVEGQRQGQWVLIDYGGEMVIHVFSEETRQFYALERLWGDAPEITQQIMDSLAAESTAGGETASI